MTSGSADIERGAFDPELVREIEYIAAVDYPVLLFGEIGVGKTTVARLIHDLSARRDGPFKEQNCALLDPERAESILFGHVKGAFTGAIDHSGLVEQANNGTLFLDEIGNLDPASQAKVLTFAESGRFVRMGESRKDRIANVRLIGATYDSGDLHQALRSRFELDLVVPPPRDRSAKAQGALVDAIVAESAMRASRSGGISAPALTSEARDRLIGLVASGRYLDNARGLRSHVSRAITRAADRTQLDLTDVERSVPEVTAFHASTVLKSVVPDSLDRTIEAIALSLPGTFDQKPLALQAAARSLAWHLIERLEAAHSVLGDSVETKRVIAAGISMREEAHVFEAMAYGAAIAIRLYWARHCEGDLTRAEFVHRFAPSLEKAGAPSLQQRVWDLVRAPRS